MNPMAMILATAEGLRWLGDKKDVPKLRKAGDAIEESVKAVLAEGKTLTYDIVGNDKASKMSEVTSAILAVLETKLA